MRAALSEADLSAIRAKDRALVTRHRRVMRTMAVTGKPSSRWPKEMLRAVYHVLAEGTHCRDPGPNYNDRRHAQRVARRAVESLERQGYREVLQRAASARALYQGSFSEQA